MYIDPTGKRWLTAQDYYNMHPTFEHPADPLYKSYFCVPSTVYESLRTYLDVMGSQGNWDINDYNLGMFNGIEMCVATIEEREPDFRTKEDQPFAFDQEGNMAFFSQVSDPEHFGPVFDADYEELNEFDKEIRKEIAAMQPEEE